MAKKFGKTTVAVPSVKTPKAKTGAADNPLVAAMRTLFGKQGGGVGLRIGFNPLTAIVDVSPKVAMAFAKMDALAQVARAWPAGRFARLRLAGARRELMAALDAVTDAELDEATRRLRDVVGRAEATGSGKKLLAAAKADVEIRYPRAPGKAASGAVPRSTAFDLVERASRAHDEIAMAQHAFDQELAVGDASAIRKAGDALSNVLAKHGKQAGLNAADVRRTQSALETVVRSFESPVSKASATAVRKAVLAAMDALPANSPMAPVLRRVLPWIRAEDWPTLMEAVAKIPPVSPALRSQGGKALNDAVRWRVGAVKGGLGAVIAPNGKYGRIRAAEVARMHRFLESPQGKDWSLLVSRTPVRATVADKTRFALSYDDAVLLANAKTKKVAVGMSAQFKAGDSSSLKALAQTNRDGIREVGGKLLVDGQQYEIELGVIPTKRVFVGTKLGVDPEAQSLVTQLGTKELDFVDLPTDPADLETMAAFVLHAGGIIPD